MRPSILLPLSVLIALLGGCSDPGTATDTTRPVGNDTAAADDAGSDPDTRRTPVLEPAECTDPTVPTDRFECTMLVLPEDRATPGERQVELPVLQISPASGPVGGPPAVYVHGGPGASGVDSWATWMSLVEGLDRDLVIYDQRGAGRSTPRLDCPEHADAMVTLLAEARAWPDERDTVAAALGACHDRLRQQGIDLDQYHTSASVQDLDDLRRALGTDTMTVVATSYGTRLALAYLDAHADHLESLVLDSVDVPGTGGPVRDRELLPAAIDRFVASCQADAACGTAHPDLAGSLERASDRLDTEPVQLPVAATDQRPATTVSVGGDELQGGIFAALYDTDVIPLIPAAIESLALGDDALLDAVGARLGRSLFENATGTLMSINCGDHGVAALESAEARSQAAADPGRSRLTVLMGSDSFCDSWPVEPDPLESDRAETPGRAAVPVLVVAGELDPITPAGESRRTAETLDAQYLEIPRGGHAPMLVSGCALDVLRVFLSDPTRPGAVPVSGCQPGGIRPVTPL